MKSREHVITNGRAVFYACCWPDLKDAALNCGWALGLHGSLNSDMDLMAMPWTEECKPVEELIKALEAEFTIPENLHHKTTISTDKPNNRVVYTIHIFADFYLDVNIISPSSEVEKLKQEIEELKALLRETVMRTNIAMPEGEQDEKQFDEKIDVEKDDNFTERIFKTLELGKI